MKIFYHNDADGKCAAHVALEKLYCKDPVECLSTNYNEPFPIDDICEGEGVVIVDFSLQPGMMEKLCKKTDYVVWIDHHVSAIEKLSGFSHIAGLRSVDFAGCELSWLYFNMAIEGHNVSVNEDDFTGCPEYVRLIGDRDTWKFKFGDRSRWFHEVFRLHGEPAPGKPKWLDFERNISVELNYGKILCEHSKMINAASAGKWAYEAMFEGHKILVCNSTVFSSELFGDRVNDYPFVSVYCHNGECWAVSLYSSKMNVVEFAEKRGGGGHPRACGFQTDTVPFARIK